MQRKHSRLFKVRAVAEIYDVSRATIYRAVESGKLPALKLGKGRGTIRIPESALASFTAACAAGEVDIDGITTESQAPASEQERLSPVVFTCTECDSTFEPAAEDLATGRTGCPECGGWTFWAELREPARRSRNGGER
ncbi:MAG: helix-turn-helix domain-containing protein [Micromonosporaceae bacterium]|nr:helix-turn-helix domain-containing protein [Micromonosporaceae bacterium]